MTLKLGELKNLKLKSVWNHEEHDFTPWLAQEEQLAKLSDAIGMDLQLERTEVPVGPYFADILAKDASGAYVVIENQFGKTDHDHLGKLLTYGATLSASAVVWIAEQFTDEHRKAVEWLNERTTDDLSLYAVRLEVLQIDNSPPAIRYSVVGQPNEVVRAAAIARSSGALTETQQLQLDFWTMFRNQLLEKKVLTSAHKPRPQYWFDISMKHSSIILSNIIDTRGSRIGTRIYISNEIADSALPQLERDKEAIEREIGEKLVWNPFPEKRDKIIGLFRQVDVFHRESWPEYCDWLIRTVVKFRAAFMPRVKALKLTLPEAPVV
jgi:hypothetical protein